MEKLNNKFTVGFYENVIEGTKTSLDSLSFSVLVVIGIFLLDKSISNYTAKGYYILGFFVNIVLFYTVGYLCFSSEKADGTLPFSKNISISFPLYMLTFTVSYWIMINSRLHPENTPVLVLYYVTVVFLYFLYIVFLVNASEYQYALGSMIFGLVVGLSWGSIIKNSLSAETSTNTDTNLSDKIIDLTSSKDVTCTAFRL
jgi:hypothetical protein